MEFKNRLIELRKKKKLLQTDVAKQIGVARATYGAYEQGNRQPDFEILEKIASLYDVTTDYLLGRSNVPGMTEDEEFESFANDPELERWYRKLPESEEEDLKKLRQMWEIIRSDKNRRD